jgi:hypothetical protein
MKKKKKWLQNFSEDILSWLKSMPTISTHYNSQSAIGMA